MAEIDTTHPNRFYIGQDGNAYLNGASFFNDAGADISGSLEVLNSLTGPELQYLDGLTPGTAAASKALVADANVDIAGLNDLGVDGTATLAALVLTSLTSYPVDAVTATADGLTTAIIGDDGGQITLVTPTSANAAHIVTLPTPVAGKIVILLGTANGYELRSDTPGSVGINGGTGATAESAIAANTMAVMICQSATDWRGFQMASDGTLAQVEAAA